jgi:hypothetical protein
MHLDPEQRFIRTFEIQTLVSGGSMTDCGYFPELFVTIRGVGVAAARSKWLWNPVLMARFGFKQAFETLQTGV